MTLLSIQNCTLSGLFPMLYKANLEVASCQELMLTLSSERPGRPFRGSKSNSRSVSWQIRSGVMVLG
jgi:hypothetical protein